MAQLTGLSGLGGPIDYMQLVPDFRGEALKTSQANAMDVQSQARQQEMATQQRDDARKQAFYGAIRTATPEQLPELRKQFPEFSQNIQQEIGIQDATHAAFVNKALGRIQVAYSSGDPQQVQAAIQSGAPALSSIGVQPEQAMQMFQSDPQQFGGLLNASMLSTLPVDKQFDVRNDQNKLAETVRSNQATEGLTARGQDITLRGQNISAQNSSLDRDIRRSEMLDKRLDRQLAQETNQLKLADLQDKRVANQQTLVQAKKDKVEAYDRASDTLDQTLSTASKVLNSPGFDNYFGVSPTKLPFYGTIPGTDAADTEALVTTLSSQGFLTSIQQMKGMGALSDAEGKKISSAISSLDSKQSDKSARAAINTIISVTQTAKDRMQRIQGKDIERTRSSIGVPATQGEPANQQPNNAGYSSLWGD